jgi:hypothetical protein
LYTATCRALGWASIEIKSICGKLAHVHHRYAIVIRDEGPFETKRSVRLIQKAKERTREHDTRLGGPEWSSAKVQVSVDAAIAAHLTDFADLLFHQPSFQAEYLAD